MSQTRWRPGGRLKGQLPQQRLQRQGAQHVHGVGAHLDAGAKALEGRRLLVDRDVGAAPRQQARERQPTDPRTNDGNLRPALHRRVPFRHAPNDGHCAEHRQGSPAADTPRQAGGSGKPLLQVPRASLASLLGATPWARAVRWPWGSALGEGRTPLGVAPASGIIPAAAAGTAGWNRP